MADATAQLSNYRQSPRKVRMVVDAVRGKRVSVALAVLDAMPKRAAGPIAKLLRSAVANAQVRGLNTEELFVSGAQVGQGVVYKRFTPRARGSSSPIRKKSSHVKFELTARKPKSIATQAPEAEMKAEAKPKAPKKAVKAKAKKE